MIVPRKGGEEAGIEHDTDARTRPQSCRFSSAPSAPLRETASILATMTKLTLAAVMTCVVLLASCTTAGPSSGPHAQSAPRLISMRTTAGDIVLELDPEHAPISVANFLAHAERGDYDGTIFHRVIPTFV